MFWSVPPLRRGWLRISSFKDASLLSKKQRRTIPRRRLTPSGYPSRIYPSMALLIQHALRSPTLFKESWHGMGTAPDGILHRSLRISFSLLVPCGVNVLTTYLRKVLHCFALFVGREDRSCGESLQRYSPKKKVGKKDDGNGTMPVISVEM